MLCALHKSLVNPFEPSSRAAALTGPNVLNPAASRSSTMPATSGASGPTTTKSTLLALQNAITAAWSAISRATHSASRAIPALPGAHQSFVVSGEAAIFQASACSRPPEPRRRMFMPRRFSMRAPPGKARKPAIPQWIEALGPSNWAAESLQNRYSCAHEPAARQHSGMDRLGALRSAEEDGRGRLWLRARARRNLRLQGGVSIRPLLLPPQGRQGG